MARPSWDSLTLADIMTRDVATIPSDATLREAVEILTSLGIHGAPVLEGSEVVGVASITDILEFLASCPGVPAEHADQSEWEEWEAEETPEDREDVPASFFASMWADAGADAFERFREVEGAEWDVLEDHDVGEVMTRKLCLLRQSASVQQAARYMVEAGIHRVLVTEDSVLVGIVSATDILRVVAGI